MRRQGGGVKPLLYLYSTIIIIGSFVVNVNRGGAGIKLLEGDKRYQHGLPFFYCPNNLF
jgi:hypothetical protein